MSGAAPLRVMTYNVRYAALDDGPRAWEHRRDAVASTARVHRPDVLCLQEVWQDQLPDLRERLPGYEWAAERQRTGEHTPVGYLPDRLAVEGMDVFALAPDPEDIGTVAWDAAVPRVATEVRFRDRRGDATFDLVNVHFDHAGALARRESARLVRERLAGSRALLVGDLNARPASDPYRSLVGHPGPFADARLVAETRFGPGETFVGFAGEGVEDGTEFAPTTGKRIDYVLVRGFDVDLYATVADVDATWRHASDHLPVVADLRPAIPD
ncbi:endonuclease/exonuclease/phosphatase family protein [Haloglomus litoreum]|uniref:endonuclease/exonuclease/phosphatase family protein n=1 Tax=Haloglomus litoreum TaxID=3034026 RepID=UPI0023E7A3F1|nr:endonuclease/exonuclease/phosphatase family protein [Haloglomus sp. DT116]